MGRSRRAGARPRLRRKLPGWIQPMPDSEPAVKAKLAAIDAYTGPGHTHGEPHEDGQARRGHRPVDAGEGAQRDGDPMLDGARGVLWDRALHADEHDVRIARAERVRNGHSGAAR